MTGTIAIIDYQMGNLRSVQKGLEHVGGNAIVTNDPNVLASADKVVLPGVGAFGDAMSELRARNLVDPIHAAIDSGKPFLGICLGLQLLFDVGFENGEQPGLGVLRGEVIRFQLPHEFKVPHMGWNTVESKQAINPLDAGIESDSHFYFVHSYYVVPKDKSLIWLEAQYGHPFCAAIHRDNLYATQFHPEKSQANGLRLLKNFVEL